MNIKHKAIYLFSVLSKATTLGFKSGVGLSASISSRKCFVNAGSYSVTGGLISLNDGAFIAGPVTASDGDYIRVQVTSSSEYETSVIATVSGPDLWIDTFIVITRVEVLGGWVDLKYFSDGDHFTY